MKNKFQTVALVGRIEDSRVAGPMRALATHLTKAGVKVIAHAPIADQINVHSAAESSLAADADMLIAVGGDGTMLYAADLLRGSERPLLGVNRGRLGFLADVSPNEMLTSVDRILEGDYTIETRLLLNAGIAGKDDETRSSTALNDVVLQRRETGRMVDFETRIGGRHINTHSGDGLIIATPTGSTAYSLSCGGPIIEPGLDAIVLVPICPHTLSDRPIVISAQHDVEVIVLPRGDTKAEVIVDGRSAGELEPGERLTVSASSQRITLIHPPGHDYYEILRSKLHWGHDSRIRDLAD